MTIWYADRLERENNGEGYTEIAYFHGVEDWEWSDIVVIRDPHGSYWIGEDSGCSCYSAFEYYSSLEDFTGPLTLQQAKEAVEISIHDDSYIKEFYDVYDDQEIHDLVEDLFARGLEEADSTNQENDPPDKCGKDQIEWDEIECNKSGRHHGT